MSSGKYSFSIKSYELEISKVVIPFSKSYRDTNKGDIYSGNEKIPFRSRHPIFKSLLRIEFEAVMREYLEIK